MPRIEHIIAAILIIWALVVIMRHASRTDADKEQPSWAVRAISAAGGNVEAKRLVPAVRELSGRGVVAAARKTREVVTAKVSDGKAKRAEARAARDERIAELGGKAAAAAAERGRKVVEAVETRWADRKSTRPPLWSRRRADGTNETEAADDEKRPSPNSPDSPEDGRTPDAGEARGGRPATVIDIGDIDEWRRQLRERREAATQDAPQDDPAAGTDPSTTQEERVTATIDTTAMPGATTAAPSIPMPADWRAVAGRVAEFAPESDADLINFMTMEIAGMCGYSDAYEQLYETCTKSLGLDQRSVQGLGEFGERVVELTKEMAAAHRRFIVIYEEVMRMVADGTVMPYNGRFFSGEVSA
ncbi:hypothetical protein ACQEVF_32330 [Nonomuraea polychroma]|uniref:hypothetical protein n=1 Tax=Nonomuraea polychroma TaxID=46176 RepID=UPI003D92DF4C